MTAVPPSADATAARPLDERIAAFAAEVVRPLAPEMGRGGVRHAGELIAEAGRRGASSAVIYDVHVSVASEPFALSEPGSGSDAASLITRAVRDGDDYVLDGTKMWITNGGEADLYLVMARTGGSGARGISAFLVEASWPGVRASRPLRKLGLRGSSTAELVLDSVRVPAARAVTRHAAELCDRGVPFTREAAVAKLVSTDAHPAAVRLRDAKACQIYEGTNQIQRLVIARELLRC